MQYLRQRALEIPLAHGFGRHRVHGSRQRCVVERELDDAQQVVDVDPRHPLAAVADHRRADRASRAARDAAGCRRRRPGPARCADSPHASRDCAAAFAAASRCHAQLRLKDVLRRRRFVEPLVVAPARRSQWRWRSPARAAATRAARTSRARHGWCFTRLSISSCRRDSSRAARSPVHRRDSRWRRWVRRRGFRSSLADHVNLRGEQARARARDVARPGPHLDAARAQARAPRARPMKPLAPVIRTPRVFTRVPPLAQKRPVWKNISPNTGCVTSW